MTIKDKLLNLSKEISLPDDNYIQSILECMIKGDDSYYPDHCYDYKGYIKVSKYYKSLGFTVDIDSYNNGIYIKISW